MDLAKFSEQVLDTNWVTIVDPRTGQDTDIRIELYSPDSKHYQQTLHDIGNRRIKQINKKGQLTAEQVESEAIELLVANTAGWEGIEDNGQVLVFSQAAATKLYSEHKWLREQVDVFLGDRRNFFSK